MTVVSFMVAVSLLAGFCRRSIRPDRAADLIGGPHVGDVVLLNGHREHRRAVYATTIRHAAWRDGGDSIAVSVDWEQALATGHVVAASSALVAGASVLLLPKGTHIHRAIGTLYGVALVLVNVAALSLHRENTFGVFHALAVASLATIAVGLSPLLLGKRSPMVIATHAYCMTWSYAGLVAAGCGQLAVAVGQDFAAWVVPVAIGTVLSISGVVIFGRVPSTLDRILAER